MNEPTSTNENSPIIGSRSIADLIGNPGDIPYDVQADNFPFFNKILPLSNLSKNEIINILDDMDLARIEQVNGMRRYEIQQRSTRENYVRNRAYASASISLASGGFAIKQLTNIHKVLRYEDSGKTGGVMNNILRRGGDNE
jgi:hypothetical protein